MKQYKVTSQGSVSTIGPRQPDTPKYDVPLQIVFETNPYSSREKDRILPNSCHVSTRFHATAILPLSRSLHDERSRLELRQTFQPIVLRRYNSLDTKRTTTTLTRNQTIKTSLATLQRKALLVGKEKNSTSQRCGRRLGMTPPKNGDGLVRE